jgi:superfamily II DNA helicase RecQ
VVDISDAGVRSLVSGGPATTTVPFGTTVRVEGTARVLAHPRCAEAFDRLREWRAERSKAAGKPAYVVFDDKTLRQVAAVLPVDEAGLLSISGIGPVKLETYGDELLAISEELRTGASR